MDLVLPWLWLWPQLQVQFKPWPGNFHMLYAVKEKKYCLLNAHYIFHFFKAKTPFLVLYYVDSLICECHNYSFLLNYVEHISKLPGLSFVVKVWCWSHLQSGSHILWYAKKVHLLLGPGRPEGSYPVPSPATGQIDWVLKVLYSKMPGLPYIKIP